MPSRYTILHNPRCGKSRETLKLLTDAGVTPAIVEYLKTPPTADELDAICTKLGQPPQALVRYKEAVAVELKLHPDDPRSRADWLQLIVEHPILLERPIVIAGKRAALGRPPENVRALL